MIQTYRFILVQLIIEIQITKIVENIFLDGRSILFFTSITSFRDFLSALIGVWKCNFPALKDQPTDRDRQINKQTTWGFLRKLNFLKAKSYSDILPLYSVENWVFSYIIYVPQLTYFHTSFPLSKSVTCDSHTSSMEPNRHVLIIICFSLNTITCIKCAMLRMDSRVVAVFTVFHLSTAKLGKQTWSFRPAATYVSYLLRRTFNLFFSELPCFF